MWDFEAFPDAVILCLGFFSRNPLGKNQFSQEEDDIIFQKRIIAQFSPSHVDHIFLDKVLGSLSLCVSEFCADEERKPLGSHSKIISFSFKVPNVR